MVSRGTWLALLFDFHVRTADKWKYHRENSSGPLCHRSCRYCRGTWAPCCLAFAPQCLNMETQHMILHCWSLRASDRSACWHYSAPQPGSYRSRSCWKAKSANLISNNNKKIHWERSCSFKASTLHAVSETLRPPDLALTQEPTGLFAGISKKLICLRT